MIYLIGKIILSLVAALGIGFGMAWALQMHLAARLREQLNSVIFEAKSRIPLLESEITNRDQVIDGLREELAKKPIQDSQTNQVKQVGSKEQEKQIEELRQKVINLEHDLRLAQGVTDSESVLELDDEDRHHDDEPELMSDDEFLADIQDIFEDADDSLEAFGSPSFETEETDAQSEETNRKNLEEELQSELEGWTDDEGTDNDSSGGQPESNFDKLKESSTEEKNPLPPKRQGVKKTASDSIDLKAELLDFEDEIRAGSEQTEAPPEFQETTDFDTLRNEVESLGKARKTLNDLVDSQAREMSGMKQQRELQDKSLSVLNQQLELARIANERVLRELRELKDATPPDDGNPHSATGH